MIRQRSQRFVDLCCLQVDRPRGLLKVYSDRDWTSCWTARLYLHTQTDLCFYESESCITLTAAKLIRTSVSLWPNFICLVSFSIVPNWFTGTIVCIACCHTFTESVQLVWASAAQELTTSAIRGRGGAGRPKFTWKLLLKQWRLCGGDGALWLLTCASEIFLLTHTHTHPFNGPFSGTTQVSWYQKGKTNLDFAEARDSEWQWHQLGHMQVCTLLQTDNHTNTPPLCFLQAGCPSCRPTNSFKALKATIALTNWLTN